MKIKSFFSAIEIMIRPNGDCSARGRACETLEHSMLTSEYGVGLTPHKALVDYANQISGKRLVVNAWDRANRKEYDVPVLVSKGRSIKKKVAKKKASKKKKTSGSRAVR